MKYEAQFTLEGGADIEATDYEEALEMAKKEAERQYGHMVASEMFIEVYREE